MAHRASSLALLALVIGLVSLLPSTLIARPNPLSTYNPSRAFPGFTLYPIEGNAEVHLLNMRGEVVHRWKVDAERARLLPNGNLLVTHGSNWGKDIAPWKDLRSVMREYSWDGSIAWEYRGTDVIARYFERLASGNTVFLQRVAIPREKLIGAGYGHLPQREIRGDSIIEISPTGEVVWQWNAHDHLPLSECGKRPCRWNKLGARPQVGTDDWTHGNTASVLPENEWFDKGDVRFRPGNILFMPRNFSRLLLIDRASGAVVWNYDGDYKGGLGGGHEALMIPRGLPGAGRILLFDNWSEKPRKQSHILEVNPLDKSLAWVLDLGTRLFSETSGAAQRLPNGNTLVSEDNAGRVLEVTPAGDVVWEFKATKEINRAQRYAPDYAPQFQNLTLGK